MENNENIILILLFACIGICIWLYSKYSNEKISKEKVSKEKNKLAKANAQLIADNALLESEQLKFQLQPHTLNNILANLKVTANKLNKGLASFSVTLEYILYHGNNHLVTVDEELNFIKEYLRLNELFIYEINAIKEDYSQVDRNSKQYTSSCIPHLISAYFIENAFKHGDITHKESLKISLKLTDNEFQLIVINKIKAQKSNLKGGLGLNNMKKRLELLVANKYEIKNSCNENEYHSILTIQF